MQTERILNLQDSSKDCHDTHKYNLNEKLRFKSQLLFNIQY